MIHTRNTTSTNTTVMGPCRFVGATRGTVRMTKPSLQWRGWRYSRGWDTSRITQSRLGVRHECQSRPGTVNGGTGARPVSVLGQEQYGKHAVSQQDPDRHCYGTSQWILYYQPNPVLRCSTKRTDRCRCSSSSSPRILRSCCFQLLFVLVRPVVRMVTATQCTDATTIRQGRGTLQGLSHHDGGDIVRLVVTSRRVRSTTTTPINSSSTNK